jgi:hypothetical protein
MHISIPNNIKTKFLLFFFVQPFYSSPTTQPTRSWPLPAHSLAIIRSRGFRPSFLFLALFSKDYLKYALDELLLKIVPQLGAVAHWRQGYTAWRQPYWRQDRCADACVELTWCVSWCQGVTIYILAFEMKQV